MSGPFNEANIKKFGVSKIARKLEIKQKYNLNGKVRPILESLNGLDLQSLGYDDNI